MRFFKIIVALSFFTATAAGATVFDCERLLRQVSELHSTLEEDFATVDAKFVGREMDLEDALTVVAALLGRDRNPFANDVSEQLNETHILKERRIAFVPSFLFQNGVRFEKKAFPSGRAAQLQVLFGAIRGAFSKDTVERGSWMRASPQDRLRLILHFKAQAVKVLFYQHRLYRQFQAFLGDNQTPKLGSESELPKPHRFLSRWIYFPRVGDLLFHEVRLTRELEAHLAPLDEDGKSDEKLNSFLEQYVDQTFVDNMDSIFNTGPALIRFETISIAALVGGGLIVAYLGGPWVPPHLNDGAEYAPRVQLPIPMENQIERKIPIDSIDRALLQFDDLAKARPLSEEEQLIQEELRRLDQQLK